MSADLLATDNVVRDVLKPWSWESLNECARRVLRSNQRRRHPNVAQVACARALLQAGAPWDRMRDAAKAARDALESEVRT